MSYARKSDIMIDDIAKNIKEIKTILSGNGNIGFCERVRNNETKIQKLEDKPKNLKSYLVAVAIIINSLIAAAALYRGVIK